MTYHPFAVTNYFIRKAQEESVELTPMKLQKLMYFAEGWNLAFSNEELFSDEIQAWQYGPVIGSVYHEFKSFGNGNITQFGTAISMDNGRFEVMVPSIPVGDSYSQKLLHQIWQVYKKYTAVQLSAMTHEPGTPWHDVYVREGDGRTRGLTIGKHRMQKYFSEAARRNQANQQRSMQGHV